MAGLGVMIRLIIRRDRIKLPLWIIGFVLLLVAMIPLLRDMYGDQESLDTMHTTFSANPAGLFMTGPMDEPTFGAFMTLETLLWWGVAIAFINALLIVRHTRHNEEIGAQELLLSGQLHRASGLMAALVVAFGVNAVIAFGLALGVEAMSSEWSTSQSWLYAVAMGVFGFVWAGLAAVVVQLVESARGANGILAGLIGGGFVLRGIGDFMGTTGESGVHEPAWVSYLSPFGWLQTTRPLTQPDWQPLVVMLVFTLAMVALGFLLLSRRDVGEGLLPSRKGNLRASRLLASPLGLTLYLQRGVFIGWFLAVLAMVSTIGALVPQMGDIFDSSDSMRQTIEAIGGAGALVPSFMSAMMAIVCLMVFAYALHGLGRLRSEEASGHLENLLATSLPRFKWAGLHVAVVFMGGLLMLAATGGLLALLTNSLSEHNLDIREYTLAGLSYAPVLLVFMALYLLLFGLLPRLAGGVTWLYFGFVAFALWLGPIVQLNQAIMNLSVLEHLSAPPAESIETFPLVVLTLVSVFVATIGVLAWRRRDLIEK